jgi:hypothetical protein
MTRPNDKNVLLLARVVRAVINGDRDAAAAELAPIAGVTRLAEPILPFRPGHKSVWVASTGAKTANPSVRTIAGVYVRDMFTCVYCLRRTIPTGILRLLSVYFVEEFAWHKNWRADITHRLYWDISTSLDHVVPASGGGSKFDVGNLATACARCQYEKGNASDWPAPKCVNRRWDGLTSLYEPLWEAVGQPPGEHARWIAAFRAASQAQVHHHSGVVTGIRRAGVQQRRRIEDPHRAAHTAMQSVRRKSREASNAKLRLAPGMFVRAQLPGKRSRRSYAVVRVSANDVQLRELWTEAGVWVAGRQPYTVSTTDIEGVELRSMTAPEPGQRASDN